MLCYLKRLIVALSLFTTFSVYSESCIPWNKSILGNNKLRVGSINIDAGNIFDLSKKRERRFLHRAANKLHITTRVSVIRDQLLFSEGNLFAVNKLAETERNLRRQNYLISAEVTPVELCGNHVNIQVKTRDNWTLTPGVTFSRLGGNNRTGVEIQEHNLFGLGKSLSLNYRKNSERNTKLFEYIDPQLFGSRRRLSLSLQDNSDGKGHTLDLNLPFYELDNKRSWGFRSSRLKQKTPLYNVGKITNKITNEKENHSIFYGWSKGRSTQNQINEEAITRYKVGWTFTKTDFLKSSNGLLTTPTKILESFPWIEYSNLKDEYITKTNFKTMGKIEDISLGRSFTLGMGFLHTSLGSDDNYLKLSGAYSNGYKINSNSLAFVKLEDINYIGNGIRKGNSLSLQTEFSHFNHSGNDLSLTTKLTSSDNLKLNEQILLGGETGLRGYPKAYSSGTTSLIFQAEKRFHFDWYPLHLAKFGAVLFSDIGTAWGGDYTDDGKLLADVGIGLRMIPTRSSSAKTIQIDLAFPLTNQENNHSQLDSYQFLIRTKNTF
jgi:outer membrane protein assembly factor BamA